VATMADSDKLPPDLTFEPDGHVTDIVLAAIADGEAGIVETKALSHVDECDHCSTRLGAEALLSAHAGELMAGLAGPSLVASKATELETAPTANVKNPGRAALPTGAIAGAIGIAILGAVPSLFGHILHLPETLRAGSRAVILIIHGANLVVHSDAGTTLAWVSSVLLLISGLVVSRLSRSRSSNGLSKDGLAEEGGL
jgi:hypothetical protein